MGWRLALCALVLVGCDPAPVPDDGGADGGPAACRASDVPGCHETCQFFYDCAVSSSLADRIEPILMGLGFSGEGFENCGGCVEQCEASTGSAAALSCFASAAEVAVCSDGAGDPTVAANATNECCEGELDATFCQRTCEATITQGSFFPACAPYLARSQPPTCAGSCPPVQSAVALGVSTDGLFVVHTAAIRDDGLIAVVGAYEDAIDFGADALPAPSNAGGQFLAVYAADGSHLWAVSLGDGYSNGLDNPRPTFAEAAAFDASGNVAVLVGLHAAVELGGTLTHAGGVDALLASFTEDGTLRWARSLGGPGDDFPHELVASGDDLFFTVGYSEAADLGGGALTSAGALDVAVVRYDTDGTFTWARTYGAAEVDEHALALAVHPSGDYTLAGGVGAGADLGEGPITAMGPTDSYIARFAPDGTLRWADVRGGAAGDFAYQLTANGEGVILADYIGSEEATATYGSSSVDGVSWSTVAYTADGSVRWAHHFSNARMNVNVLSPLDVDTTGRVAVGTDMFATVDYGGGELPNLGGGDSGVVAYDADGTHRWSMGMGTAGYDPAPRVHRLTSGELMVVGLMTGELDYGSGVLTRTSTRDIYVLRFAAD